MIRFDHWFERAFERVHTIVFSRSSSAARRKSRTRSPRRTAHTLFTRRQRSPAAARSAIGAVLIAGILALGSTAALAEDATAVPLDINTASAELLAEHLERVGKVRAEAIVAWREENGSFSSIDQLVLVPGISQSVLDLNRDRLTVK